MCKPQLQETSKGKLSGICIWQGTSKVQIIKNIYENANQKGKL